MLGDEKIKFSKTHRDNISKNSRSGEVDVRKKISNTLKGRKLSEEHKLKIRLSTKGINKEEKNNSWKGDKVGYSALHAWVYKKLGKPDTCENCLKTNLFGMSIHWANISHEYKRDVNDWIRLCVKCHHDYDRKDIKVYRNLAKLKEPL